MKNNLKALRKKSGFSQVELAEKLNTTQGMIGLLERGERKLSPDWLKRISQILSCSPLDILPDLNIITPTIQPNQNSVSIEMINATACCGNGVENFAENVIGFWQMPKEEYRAISTIAPDNVKMLRVFGDSMETTLSDGDWVLVDISRKFFDSDGIFLIRLSTGLAVKRIQGTIGTDVVICSDNPKYRPITAPTSDVIIVGKVIYTLKAEKVG